MLLMSGVAAWSLRPRPCAPNDVPARLSAHGCGDVLVPFQGPAITPLRGSRSRARSCLAPVCPLSGSPEQIPNAPGSRFQSATVFRCEAASFCSLRSPGQRRVEGVEAPHVAVLAVGVARGCDTTVWGGAVGAALTAVVVVLGPALTVIPPRLLVVAAVCCFVFGLRGFARRSCLPSGFKRRFTTRGDLIAGRSRMPRRRVRRPSPA